ncbi:GNAT family N-acetyltransferase [Streptomyces sp. NPDC058623]|uniref:GNAT family N-acetyltransferase n=1 Tax=Streptomyces sp. NPDC058623 TaxID=3346563 RepID=UPI003669F908
MRIRAAVLADLPVCQDIERAAGECFRDIGMTAVADDDPLPLEELARYAGTGLAWVAAGPEDRPLAYLIAEPVDGALHVEQVSVHPTAARKGVGRALLEHAALRALARHDDALTLTTFTAVPWNAPYYLRCGFRILADEELGPGLREIRRQEARHGLDRWPRVCMGRTL